MTWRLEDEKEKSKPGIIKKGGKLLKVAEQGVWCLAKTLFFSILDSKRMSGRESTLGQRLRSKLQSRIRATFFKKNKMRNRRLVEIIKRERNERAALHAKIRQHEEAMSRYTCEIKGLKAQLDAVKAALNETTSIIDEGISHFQLAKVRCHEIHESIAEDTTGSSKLVEQGSAAATNNTPPVATSSSSNSNQVPNPPPKLQARVNPMVQGVQLMNPSIMLQRLQPDDLERQMSSASRETTPTFNNLGHATVRLFRVDAASRHDDESTSSSEGTDVSSFWHVQGSQNNKRKISLEADEYGSGMTVIGSVRRENVFKKSEKLRKVEDLNGVT
ncbi:hypothetical protein GE061_000809 [Apolygus lucorum]|uniref:Uncharacterized protein n=1 Tax=Apolygus lucorum TaxID=248454 RepID=A0A8S9Y5D6_APOLU|nr:hypothetical protein GE061_000809 [Apolygus lucorum]